MWIDASRGDGEANTSSLAPCDTWDHEPSANCSGIPIATCTHLTHSSPTGSGDAEGRSVISRLCGAQDLQSMLPQTLHVMTWIPSSGSSRATAETVVEPPFGELAVTRTR